MKKKLPHVASVSALPVRRKGVKYHSQFSATQPVRLSTEKGRVVLRTVDGGRLVAFLVPRGLVRLVGGIVRS